MADNAQTIWTFLKAAGLSDAGTAALMGNLEAESALDPCNLQNSYESSLGFTDATYTKAVDNKTYTNFVNDAAGYGLAQWTYYTRKQALYNYAVSKGASIGDLTMQLEFLVKELKSDYASVWSMLKTATNVRTASDAVLTKYERPAVQTTAVKTARAALGTKYYETYAGGSSSTSTTVKEGSTMASKCTAAQAVEAMTYWIGYYEKASSSYATTRDKTAFEKNKGSNNYTYAGYLCGIQGGAWCAMQVSTAIYEACGSSKELAKEVMYGVWPYSACNQLYDAAPSSAKGRRGSWTPQAGDIIVFQQDGSRTHTGMVYAADSTYVYTIEGNSSNMCRKRSYLKSSTYIYGYVRPKYATGSTSTTSSTSSTTSTTTGGTTVEQYGNKISGINVHVLSKGCAGPEVKTVQRIMYAYGYLTGSKCVDGDFGTQTKAATVKLQAKLGLTQDGIWGIKTWSAALTELG